LTVTVPEWVRLIDLKQESPGPDGLSASRARSWHALRAVEAPMRLVERQRRLWFVWREVRPTGSNAPQQRQSRQQSRRLQQAQRLTSTKETIMATLNVDNGSSAAIRYEVVKNFAQSKAKGVNIYNARVQAPTKSLREVADTMVREGCKYEPGEVVAILEKFANVTTRLLQEGNAINVGSLVRFRPSICGTFKSLDTGFSKADHRIIVKASVGTALRNVAATAPVERVTSLGLPELQKVYNAVTGKMNTMCSEGDIIVMGKRFIWNEEAEDEGFFTEVEGNVMKCEVFNLDKDNASAFMHTKQFMMEGDEAQLIFRTRNTSTGELAVFKYDVPLAFEAAEQNA
jgi:hypothetical protein